MFILLDDIYRGISFWQNEMTLCISVFSDAKAEYGFLMYTSLSSSVLLSDLLQDLGATSILFLKNPGNWKNTTLSYHSELKQLIHKNTYSK